jgi:endoglucanase
MKTIALIYILLLIYSTIQAQTVPAMKNFNLNYKFYKNDFADEWVEVKGENFYRECKDEWINSIINVEESGKVLYPLRFKSGSIGLPTNPVQQLSKGAGFSQAFEVFSPYNIQFNYYTIEDFQNVKKLGLNSIRLPIFMDNMFEEKSSTMNPLFFYLLDQYVDMAENEGLNLILTNMSGFDYANDPIIQDKFINIWKQMAEHYKNRSTKILYELANEPNGITDEAWGQIQGNVIDVIRKIDQTHTIIVTPIWDGLANLEKLPDYEDENLIYAFHFYDPFLFTHQGVINASLGDLVGVPFPYNEEEMPSMPASFVGNWYEGLYYDYKTDATAVEIRKLIDTAAKFKNERNVPLWCGEFGVVGGTDHDDRVYWYNVLRSSLEENGIPWSMHGYIRYSGPFEYGTYHYLIMI